MSDKTLTDSIKTWIKVVIGHEYTIKTKRDDRTWKKLIKHLWNTFKKW